MKVPHISKNFSLVDSVVCFLSGLIVFTLGLQSQEIIGFESRFYLFALEMWRHGVSAFPTTYQQSYPDYPVTSTLVIYVIAKLFGELNKLVAILPSAIAASMTLVVTYRIGALHSRRWGISGALLLLFTLAFVEEARTISIDQYITLITALCFYIVYLARLRNRNGMQLYFLLPLLLLGFLIRGPIGLIIPTGVILVFYCIEKEFKKLIVMGTVAICLLLVCSFVLGAVAYHVGRIDLVQQVLEKEVIGRLHAAKAPPFYFYLGEGVATYAVTFPLMLLMLPFLFARLKQEKMLAHLLGWILVIVAGLTIVGDKKIRYVLSIAPALALWCAYLFVAHDKKTYLRFLQYLIYAVCFFLPLGCLLLFLVFRAKLIYLVPHDMILVSVLLLMQAVNVLLYFKAKEKSILTLLVAVVAFLMVYILVVEPINLKLNKTHEFVLKAEEMRLTQRAQLVFFRDGSDGLAIKYLVNVPIEIKPIFVNNVAALKTIANPAFIVTSAEYFSGLPADIVKDVKVVMRGRIGTDNVVIFNKNASRLPALF